MNCLISHRIDTKLYILRKWQQACLNTIELVVMSVSQLDVGLHSAFLPALQPFMFESSEKQ